MLNAILNGILTPFMAVVLIPRALRAQDTGIYRGFRDVRLFYYVLIVACTDLYFIYPRFGFSIEAVIRLALSTAVPFVGGYMMVKVSDRFRFNIEHQVRKTGQRI